MLAHVAGAFAAMPGVAGYDLMNEPNAFGAEENTALSALYAAALPAVRDAERAAGGAPRLVFFEPSALWSLTGNGPPPPFDHDRDIVYAPHVYAGSLSVAPLAPASFQVARDEAALFGGAPVVSGEWGSDPRQAADPSDPFFAEHQRLQDAFRFGATLWTWHESCGDPHKQADLRAGRVPYVWGEFEVDCTTNTITGLRTALVAALTRAYVRAAPGRLLDTQYDPATGAFSAHGADAASGTPLLAFYPASLHGTPALTSSGLDDLQMLPAPGANLYVVGRAAGGAWMLQTE
jgi:endoglycosylceramidase